MKKLLLMFDNSSKVVAPFASSIASYAKMLCVMMCMQLICMSASATTITMTSQDASKVTFTYYVNGSGSPTLKVIKSDDVTKYYGNFANCPAVYTCSLSTGSTSTVTLYTSSYENGNYTVAIMQNGTATAVYGFEVKGNGGGGTQPDYKNPASISVKQNMNSIVYTYTLPKTLSSPYIKVIKYTDMQNYSTPDKAPAFQKYNVSRGTTTMTQSIASWEKGIYIICLYNNSLCVATTSINVTPLQYDITGVSIDYAKQVVNVSYEVASGSTIQISGYSNLSKTVSTGKGTVSLSFSDLKTGTYTAEVKGSQSAKAKKSFTIYRSACSIHHNNTNKTLKVSYEVGGSSASADIRLYDYSKWVSSGVSASYTSLKKVSQRSGSFTASTSSCSPGAYIVVLVTDSENAKSDIFSVYPLDLTMNVSVNRSAKTATITYSGAPTESYIKIVKKSDSTVKGTYTNATTTVSYSTWAAGDYLVSLLASDGTVLATKTLSVHKITKVRQSGDYIYVDYDMGSFKNGSYTVMRFVNPNGNTFNEVSVNYNQTEPTGTVQCYCRGNGLTSGTYVISFVVEGVVVDTQKIYISM